MNDHLIQQWRDGDATATTAVRNGLRAVADAVVGAPATGRTGTLAADAEQRREATGAVAREVMQRGGSTVDELQALAVMVAARHVVIDQRNSIETSAIDSHLPPQLVVSLAMAPDSLSSHARDVAQRHVGECTGCSDEVALVRDIVKRIAVPATQAAGRKAKARPNPAPVKPQAAAKTAPPQRASAPHPAQRRAAATQQGRGAGGPLRPPRGGRLDRPDTVGWVQAFWPVLAIGAVIVAMMFNRVRSERSEARAPGVASIADRTAPEPPSADQLPDDASSALIDLERGQCRLAAARFRTSRMNHPDAAMVAWAEGISWVCAGDGEAARLALEAYVGAGGSSSPELLWYQAQAALLEGRAGEARERLVRLRPLADIATSQRIDEQLNALRSTGS